MKMLSFGFFFIIKDMYSFLKLISFITPVSKFLLVPLFHLTCSSVQLLYTSSLLTAYSIFHSRTPTWMQDMHFPAMQEQSSLYTVPTALHGTQGLKSRLLSFVMDVFCFLEGQNSRGC